jgi:hygromycin-B 7''-O-kinase
MLPAVLTDEEWTAVVGVEEIMQPGAEHLAARLGLAGQSLRRYPEGSFPVYAVGDRHVLKLYPTVCAEDGRTEARVLEHVQGKLPVATPEVHADGEYENGWRYILMSQLTGQGLADSWPSVPGVDRERLASEVGETLGALHALDTEPLRGVLGPPSWSAFLTQQCGTAVARQRKDRLPDL